MDSALPLVLGDLVQTTAQALPFVCAAALCWRAHRPVLPAFAAALALVPIVYALAHLAGVIAIARAGGDEREVRGLWFHGWGSTPTLLRSARCLAVASAATWVAWIWRGVAKREVRVRRAALGSAVGIAIAAAPRALVPLEDRVWYEEYQLRGDAAWRDLQSTSAPPRWLGTAPASMPRPFSIGRASSTWYDRAWACGVDPGQRLVCWDPERSAPTLRAFPAQVGTTEVGVGTDRVCALETGGRARCWRADGRELPAPAIDHATSIATSGPDVCVRTSDARAICWEYTWELRGVGDTEGFHGPWTLPELDVGAVAIGRGEPCTVSVSGAVTCAGPLASLGSSPVTLRPMGLEASEVDGTWLVAASGSRLCAVHGDAVRCVELAAERETTSERSTAHAVQIAVADDHVCARTGEGRVECWGQNEWGQCDEHDVTDATWVAVRDAITCVARTRGVECRGRSARH
jgi:hypothetical protein